MSKEWTLDSVWSLTHSFMESRIFLAGYEMGLFDLLSPHALTVEEVAFQCGMSIRNATLLLDALTAMGILTYTAGRYSCEPTATPFLTRDGYYTMNAIFRHATDLWSRWINLPKYLKNEGITDPLNGGMRGIETELFIPLDGVVELINPYASQNLVSVGITSGRYITTFLNMVPGISITVTDRQDRLDPFQRWLTGVLKSNDVSREVKQEIPGLPLALQRVTFINRDLQYSVLPQAFDLAFLSFVIQQNYFDQNVKLLRNVYHSLVPGGRIIVRDILCAPERNNYYFSAIFAVNSIVETQGKSPYTFEEVKAALEQSGFVNVSMLNPATWMDGVIEAYRPLAG